MKIEILNTVFSPVDGGFTKCTFTYKTPEEPNKEEREFSYTSAGHELFVKSKALELLRHKLDSEEQISRYKKRVYQYETDPKKWR